MIFSRVFVYSYLFLVILVFIPLVKSREFKCRCCGVKNQHYKPTCPLKDNCPLRDQKVVGREFKCKCCGVKNQHYKPTCPLKDNCPLRDQKEVEEDKRITISKRDCFFKIEAKNFIKKGEKIKPSCYCARKEDGDEQCHGIANMLGGPGECDNCMSCSHQMNTDMKRMEKFVRDSDGGVYIVTCDNYKYAKTITQIFKPYKGYPTTTVIFRKSPTIHHDEI